MLVIAIPNSFDLNGSTPAQTIRWGYFHGAMLAGIDAQFVEYDFLPLPAASAERPIFWLTYDDYRFLSADALRMLRDYPHIVAVNTWFVGMKRLHRDYNAPSPVIPEELRRSVLDSEPDFVWCSAPDAYLEFYQGWADAGMKVVSLPWACDTARYYPTIGNQFSDVEMAFVGGYRGYKEPQYEARLWPYQDRLKVWGYSRWPRCYQGHLPNEQERALYSQAQLCPTLSEPQFAVTGDTVERPFKVMGCRGLTILDMPCYHELFTEDEALIATRQDEYDYVVNKLMTDEELCIRYRDAGYKAVLKRHSYAHRVSKILEELER